MANETVFRGGQKILNIVSGDDGDILIARDPSSALITLGSGLSGDKFWRTDANTTLLVTDVTISGGKVRFTPTSGFAGLNVGSYPGNPGGLGNADVWYNTSTSQLMAKIAGLTSVIPYATVVSATRVPFYDGTNLGQLSTNAGFFYNTINNTLAVGRVLVSTSGTQAGLGIQGFTSDPSVLNDGDVWYNTTAGGTGSLMARIAGNSASLNWHLGQPTQGLIAFYHGSNGRLVTDPNFNFNTNTDVLTVPQINGTTALTLTSNSGNIISVNKHVFTSNSISASINIGAFAGDPSSTVNFDVWGNNVTNTIRTKLSSVVHNLITSPETIGTAGQVLTSNGTTANWEDAVGDGWPLTGSADLTGDPIIRGNRVRVVYIGEADGANQELSAFYVNVNAGDSTGYGQILVDPGNIGIQTEDLLGQTFGSLSVSNGSVDFVSGNSGSLIREEVQISARVDEGIVMQSIPLLDNAIDYVSLIQSSPEVGAAGLGVGTTFVATNAASESYIMAQQAWSYTDAAVDAEDVTFELNGSVAGTLEPFLTIKGGTDKQFQVYGPLKLLEDATPPAAADHEGALIYTGSAVQYSDGSSWVGFGTLFGDGGTSGRIALWSSSNSIGEDANFSFDTVSDRLLIGASDPSPSIPGITLAGSQCQLSLSQIGNNALNGNISMFKTRGATPVTHTIVQSGDVLGVLEFLGSDGTAYRRGAFISAVVGGTPGVSDMPGDLLFNTTPDGSVTATEKLRITADGRVYGKALHNNAGSIAGTANQYIASGSYSPTTTNVLNATSSSASNANFMRVGNVMTVSGFLTIDVTGSGGVQVAMSLPVASNLGSASDLAGTSSTGLALHGRMDADTTNDRAVLTFTATGAGSVTFAYHYTYLVN